MRLELQKSLAEKYPLIFKDRNQDSHGLSIKISVNDGWYSLIDGLCEMLYSDFLQATRHYKYFKDLVGVAKHDGSLYTQEEIDEYRIKAEEAAQNVPIASQVKEKYGGLRFYVQYSNDKHNNYIDMAESLSYRICECCGTMDDVRTWEMSWVKTFCKTHAEIHYGKETVEHYLKGKKDED